LVAVSRCFAGSQSRIDIKPFVARLYTGTIL
jgi:hypothetical protein